MSALSGPPPHTPPLASAPQPTRARHLRGPSRVLLALCGALGLLALACEDDPGEVPTATDHGVLHLFDYALIDQGTHCIPSPEICNGVDDDCDGLIDEEDPDLQRTLFTDIENCGRCFRSCIVPNATTICAEGDCYLTACTPGFSDSNGRFEDGCEAACLISNGGAEICDGLDNDCDGFIDEGFDLDNDPLNCGACGEACPTVAGAVIGCVEGRCAVTECERDTHDLDGDPHNGCEYACVRTSTDQVREFCNGFDDDCDGLIDEVEDLVAPPAELCGTLGVCAGECSDTLPCPGGDTCVAGVCLSFDGQGQLKAPHNAPCAQDEDCARVHPGFACVAQARAVPADGSPTPRTCQPRQTQAVCDAEAGWRCARPPTYQYGHEIGLCDGLDNDCDGRVDEDYAATLLDENDRPRSCEAGVGACRVSAFISCTPDGLGTYCPAQALPPATQIDNTCNGVDDDCDGEIDEDYRPAWVRIGAFEIFAYEASRPGATATEPGVNISVDPAHVQYRENLACSVAGVLPWADVNYTEAEAACAAVGARLCTQAEWGRACATAQQFTYPYGHSYEAQTCNGGGYDIDRQGPGLQQGPLPTGEAAQCVSGGVYDLSGNLKEWTDDARDGLRAVRGGGYESNIAQALSCTQLGDLKSEQLRSPSLGFRCCRDL